MAHCVHVNEFCCCANNGAIPIGNLLRTSADFFLDGRANDPDTVQLIVRDPTGTVTTHEYGDSDIVRLSAGSYRFDIDANQAGTWYYRWVGSGTPKAAEEREFNVQRAKTM